MAQVWHLNDYCCRSPQDDKYPPFQCFALINHHKEWVLGPQVIENGKSCLATGGRWVCCPRSRQCQKLMISIRSPPVNT